MNALSTNNESPENASRPFDLNRDGFVMGEGAAVIILEEWSIAEARGATILGEVLGGASNADAHHITAPAPGGATLTIKTIPAGYYDTVDATNSTTLRATLHDAIDDHTKIPYTSSSTDTWVTGLRPASDNNSQNMSRDRSVSTLELFLG